MSRWNVVLEIDDQPDSQDTKRALPAKILEALRGSGFVLRAISIDKESK